MTKAKQELMESAYPTGFTASIDTTNCCGFPDVLQVLAVELQKIEIKLNITSVTSGKFVVPLYGPKSYGATFSNLYPASKKVTIQPFAALSYQIPWALLVKPTT